MERSELYQRFYEVIRRVPRGRVVTYGQVAILAGAPRNARHVGYALRNTPAGERLPWHRVVNASGEISRRARSDDDELQRILLEGEGVEFDLYGRINLERFRWNGRPPGGRRRSPPKASGRKSPGRGRPR